MSQGLDLEQLHQISGPGLQNRLLTELDRLFDGIEDGSVKENSFVGCIALGHSNFPPLSESQSAQIKELLSTEPVADDRSENDETEHSEIAKLGFVLNLIRNFWHRKDTDARSIHPASDHDKSYALLLDPRGRVKDMDVSPADGDRNAQMERREINETDVKRFFNAHGADLAWVLPYCWDIANRLSAVKAAETEGDVALFLERRKKLNVRRPKATLFEQSAQRYAAKISELYCDESGGIIDKESLEAFIHELVIRLLDKSKDYWPMSPLLAIFDGVVATVIRPLLYKHRTMRIPHDTTTESGIIISENIGRQAEKLITAPKWNDDSIALVEHHVEKAFKSQVSFFFLDRFAPYNREYSKSPHLDAVCSTNVGFLVKEFGKPIHLKQVMELVRPTGQEEELVQYVEKHFRSDDFLDH